MSKSLDDVELEEEFFPTNVALLQRWIPWVRLFRGFRIAVDYRCLLLALVAVYAWAGGNELVSRIPLDPEPSPSTDQAWWPWEQEALPATPATRQPVRFADAAVQPWRTMGDAFRNGQAVLWPLANVLRAAAGIFSPSASPGEWLRAWLYLLWGLTVCAALGGAIGRVAAVEFVGQGEGSLGEAIRFSLRHYFFYVSAPLITTIGIGLCWFANLLAGWMGCVPIVGEYALAVFWFVPMILSLLLALVLVGVAAGWPLMMAAISVDAGDAFDGLSRAASYIFNQPWYALFLSGFTVLYGSALLYFVVGMKQLAVSVLVTSVSMGYGDFAELGAGPRRLMDAWECVVESVPAAFVFSFFWTSATIIYFLLRRREDGTPLHLIGSPEGVPDRSGIPLSGMPAAHKQHQDRDEPTTQTEPDPGETS